MGESFQPAGMTVRPVNANDDRLRRAALCPLARSGDAIRADGKRADRHVRAHKSGVHEAHESGDRRYRDAEDDAELADRGKITNSHVYAREPGDRRDRDAEGDADPADRGKGSDSHVYAHDSGDHRDDEE